MTYKKCSCPKTCENTICQKDTCVPGCQCPDGTYDNGTSCVTIDKCYCIVNGTVMQVRLMFYLECKILWNSNFKLKDVIVTKISK